MSGRRSRRSGQWRAGRAASETRRLALAQERAERQLPDIEGDVWLNAATTALVLRLSLTRVNQLAADERLPFTKAGRQRWFRRSHIEQIAAARALRTKRR